MLNLALVTVFGAVVKLSASNWDAVASERHVFVKFYASWCGHCKRMKPDWERLGNAVTQENIVIASVDCTDPDAESLCEKYHVQGFPTLKTFFNASSVDYNGERDFDSLWAYVTDMQRRCSANDTKYCSKDGLALIRSIQEASHETRERRLRHLTAFLETLDAEHEDLIQELHRRFEESTKNLAAQKSTHELEISILKSVVDVRSRRITKEEL